jgi:tetratricopeptide (TPR) repeat protein
MKKIELILLSILSLFYLLKMIIHETVVGFVTVNFIIFLIFSIGGFKIYQFNIKNKKTNWVLFSIFIGISFATGMLSISSKVMLQSNIPAIILFIPNLILFILLIWLKSQSKVENSISFKGLLIRSFVILSISLTIILSPIHLINKYINRDNPILYNQYLYNYYNDIISEEFKKGNYDGVLNNYEKIKEPLEIVFNDNSFEEAKLRTMVGVVYQEKEDYSKSIEFLISSLNIYDARKEPKHLYYSTSLMLLANSLRNNGNYKDAIDIYIKTISILRKDTTQYTSEKYNAETEFIIDDFLSNVYSNKAYTFSLMKNNKIAEELFSKSFSNQNFKNSNYYFNAIMNYAHHNLNIGKIKKAKQYFEKAKQISYKESGMISLRYLSSLEGLIETNLQLAEFIEAEINIKDALNIQRKVPFNKKNIYTSLIYSKARLNHYIANYKKASELYDKALKHSENDTIIKIDILTSISNLEADLTNYKNAIKTSTTAYKLAQIFFNHDTTSILKYIKNQAYLNYCNDSYDRSLELYEICDKIETKTSDSLNNYSTINGIGLVMTEKKHFEMADSLFTKSLKIYKKLKGENFPDYSTILNNKGFLYVSENKLIDAEVLFNQSLKIMKSIIPNHDIIADSYYGIGLAKFNNQNYSTALIYFEKALKIYTLKFNIHHLDVIKTKQKIKDCKTKLTR